MAKSKPKAAKGARVPDVRKPAGKGTVVAVLISDCHFSAEKPAARAGTKEEWWDTQFNHLQEVLEKAVRFGCPLVIAGDVFDTWNQPVEIVNMVAEAMANYDCPVYMVPGQHDLPYHELHEVNRSAIYNLMMAARGLRQRSDVYLLTGNIVPLGDTGWWVYGAAWGVPFDHDEVRQLLKLSPEPEAQDLEEEDVPILLCAHKYIHVGRGTSYPGAKAEDSAMEDKFCSRLDGYAACLFGDNHIPFTNRRHCDGGDYVIYNHGALIRRKSDERKFDPEMGVLYADGSIERLPVTYAEHDLWHDGEDEYTAPDKQPATMTEFAESVKALAADETVDFRAACNRLLGVSKLSTAAKREILELLDDQ